MRAGDASLHPAILDFYIIGAQEGCSSHYASHDAAQLTHSSHIAHGGAVSNHGSPFPAAHDTAGLFGILHLNIGSAILHSGVDGSSHDTAAVPGSRKEISFHFYIFDNRIFRNAD